MANKLISQMGLPKPIANVLAARNIVTAKDALSLTEYELMELSDVGLAEIVSAMIHISEIACPPHQTALALLEQQKENEYLACHLPTRLKGVDVALCGGIPFSVVTELVGPAGVGKTQFCLKLSLLACLPSSYGGLDGCVIYIDTESKFSSRRMIEIGMNSFPEVFQMEGMTQQMAGRILVLQPASLSEFTDSLHKVKISLLQCKVKLLIIDSMAAVVSGFLHEKIKIGLVTPSHLNLSGLVYVKDYLLQRESGQGQQRQHSLAWHTSFIKSLAEFSRIPVIVTNQVRLHSGNDRSRYNFEVQNAGEKQEYPLTYDSHLVAALGVSWAHAVSIRLVLETRSGQRFIKIAKSSMSPSLAFPFTINASGISLLDDEGAKISGPEANMIYHEGQGGLAISDSYSFE